MYPTVKELYSKAKEYLSHRNHLGASVPLGMVAIAMILTAGLVLQVKVLQQETHTSSKASEPNQAIALANAEILQFLQNSQANRAQDTSFEATIPGTWTNLGPNWSFDFTEKKIGARSIRLDTAGDNPGLYQRVTFKPNTTYTWVAYVKTKDNKRPRMVIAKTPGAVDPVKNISAVNKNGDSGYFVLSDSMTLGTTDWHFITASFKTGNEQGIGDVYINLQGGSFPDGAVWFDSLFLLEGDVILPTIPDPIVIGNPVVPVAPDNLKSGLVAYWRFDESTGTTFKDEMNGNTASGNVGVKEGKVGWARNFQPVVAAVGQLEAPIQPELTVTQNTSFTLQQFSINAWIFPRSYRAWASIFNHRGVDNKGISFELHNSTPESAGLMQCAISSTSVATTHRLPLNQWSMVTCTVTQNKQLTVYVNGVQSGTTTFATDIPYSANPLTKIGKNIVSGEVFDGIVDEVGVWNRGVTAQEITQLYAGGNALNFTQFDTVSSGPPPAPTVQAVNDCVNQNQVGEYIFHISWPATLTGITAIQIASQPGFGGDVYTSRNLTQNGNTYMVKGPSGFKNNTTDLVSSFQGGKQYYVRIFKGDSLPGPAATFTVPACGATTR